MKKIITLIALVLSVGIVAAQNTGRSHIVGVQTTADGTMQVIEPSTVIAVDITLEQEQIIPGPYARYAQKYLGTRASLVERTSFAVTDAKVGVVSMCEATKMEQLPDNQQKVASHMGSDSEFAKILPNRLENTVISPEQAAEQAAQAIFTIRKHRMELITGEAGENVFGAGLKDALEALDKSEADHLELFFGKHITTTTHHRYIVVVEANKTAYPLVGFNSTTGLEAADEQSNSVISLKLTPSASSQLGYTPTADAKAKSTVDVRVANNTTCDVILNDEAIASVVVPMFEFGTTIKVAK